MAIEFRCPNGHRLSCPDERAGKPAKCPKCGAEFMVPTAEAAVLASGNSGISSAAVADSGSISSIGSLKPAGGAHLEQRPIGPGTSGGASPGEVIVFLCPNGHKLNCPISMQGKPGKCPHCGARFLIPEQHEEQEDFTGEHDDDEEFSDEHHDEHDEEEEDIELEVADDPETNDSPSVGPPELPFDFSAGLGGPDSREHGLYRVFNELWDHRQNGATIDVHLRGGITLTPHRYADQWSQQETAVFAVKEADGTYTVTAVAWEQIERVAVRKLTKLPTSVFP
jgi:DNA-directed RNA polymerase subunit RPC12/RpoP